MVRLIWAVGRPSRVFCRHARGLLAGALVVSYLLWAVTALTARSASAAGLTYIYDDLGRLSQVIDAQGNVATYTYDAVGNILAVDRGAPPCPVQAPTVTNVTAATTCYAGTSCDVTIEGNSLLGASVSTGSPQAILSKCQAQCTQITCLLTPSFAVASGPLDLSIITSFGSTQAAIQVTQNYPQAVLADHPVAYYRLNEVAGTLAMDSSGSGRDGTYIGNALLGQPSVVPQFGTSVLFDGMTAFVDVPNSVGGDFSLEAWINTTATSLSGSQGFQGNGIIWADAPYVHNDFALAILNNRLAFFTGNPDTTVVGSTVLNDGRWHYIVATRTRGVGTAIYVDGEPNGTGTTNGNVLSDNPRIHIGANTFDRRYFQGLIDEVALYDHVLSDADIQSHFQATQEPAPRPASSERTELR